MAGIVAELAAACDNDSDLDEMRREAVDRLERIRAEEVLEILGDAEIERRVEEERGQEDDGANDPTECPVCEAHHGGGTDTLLNGVCVICSYDQTVAGLGWFRRRDADLARLT